MGEDEWIDMQGLRLAAVQLAWRVPPAAAVAAVGIAALHLFVAYLESALPSGFLIHWGLMLCVAVPTGIVEGLILARGMVNRTGLDAKTLTVVVYAALVVIHAAVYFIATALTPDWQTVHFHLCGATAVVAMVYAAKRLLTS